MEYRVKGQSKVKALKGMTLEVLGIPFGGPFGGRDAYREYFDEHTDLHLDLFPTPPAVYYHGNDSDGWQADIPQYLGKTTKVEQREDGVWFEILLDEALELARHLYEMAKQGLLRASSGSAPHLVRIDEDTGHIEEWPVVEISLLDLSLGQAPANPYAVAIPVMKAIYKQAGIALPDFPKSEAAEAQAKPGRSGAGASKTQPTKSQGATSMEYTEAQLAQVRADAAKEERERIETEAKAKADREKEIEDAKAEAVKAAQTKWEEENKDALEAARKAEAKKSRLFDGDTPDLLKFAEGSKFANLDPGAHALLVETLNSEKGGKGASEQAVKALANKLLDEGSRDKDRRYARSLAAMKAAGMPLKANELNQSTLANYGAEWVGETSSAALWEKIRLGAKLLEKIPTVEIPQGVESITIPYDAGSATFYKVAQASATDSGALTQATPTVPASKMGTGNRELKAGKIGARVLFTGELTEDSLIPFIETLQADLAKEGAEVMEHVAIDGDVATGATTNINTIGGTPAGSEAYLLLDGFRKLALVTNTANSRDGGALGVDDYLKTLQLMGLGGRNALDKSKVAFIIDAATHYASLQLNEVLTLDKRSAPTVENGQLTGLWGTGIFVSGNMHRANQDATYGLKANAAGKVDLTTPANNTKGAILAVRWDQWLLGMKRLMTMEVERIARADAWELVALARFGLVYRDTEASAISYNITV
ncbi:MAG: hypothetical protein KF821_09045 [Anaerolineales bacterium]|nr:hypothetical protein [Anaerolineales bacterium]